LFKLGTLLLTKRKTNAKKEINLNKRAESIQPETSFEKNAKKEKKRF